MIAQKVIASSVGIEATIRLTLVIFMPLDDDFIRVILGVAYLVASIAGFIVIRWDQRERVRTGEV